MFDTNSSAYQMLYGKQNVNQPSRQDLLSVIASGTGYTPSYGGNSAASNLNATANSTPVKLMQKFVNNRGWGQVDTTGMYDWQGTPVSGGSSSSTADADRWAALAQLLSGQYYSKPAAQPAYYKASSHNSTGAGGYGR